MTTFFILFASAIHLYIFCLESLLWGRPKTNRAFGMSAEVAEHNRLFAFNQGFYNLFLGLGALIGIYLGLQTEAGKTLVAFTLVSMSLAAVVLIISNGKLWRAALIQGVPPLFGLVCLVLM